MLRREGLLLVLLVLLANRATGEPKGDRSGEDSAPHGAQATKATTRQAPYEEENASANNNNNKTLKTKPSGESETLEGAPTITSLHQVWTSSSSGRLDELSPEMISKLRNDVPFLAAYALRPRLVGASGSPLTHLHQQATSSEAYQQPAISGAGERQGAHLETAASNGAEPRLAAARAPATSSLQELDSRTSSNSLVPKLGDFSEFNVETSSLSKSEHHHKRKTSLKRQPKGTSLVEDEAPLEFSSSSLRRQRLASGNRERADDSLDQLVRRLRQRQRTKARTAKRRRLAGRQTGKRSSKARRRRADKQAGRTRSGKKSGRLLFQDEAVKGGGGGSRDKPPFYAAKGGASSPKASPPDDREASEDRAAGGERTSNAVDEEDEDENRAIDDEPRLEEPKRVGDDDVEADNGGDTVLVEPKSDGVDDDPPLPDSLPEDEEDAEENRAADEEAREKEGARPDGGGATTASGGSGDKPETRLAPEGDPRGNRVNRQKPNLPPPIEGNKGATDEDEDEPSNSAGGGQVAGGGIGTTLGGNGGASGGNGGAGGTTPGVEFADRDRDGDDDADERDDRRGGTAGSSGGGGSTSSGDGDFGDRRRGGAAGGGGPASAGGGTGGKNDAREDDEDKDLDYRDEMAEAERTGGGKGPKTGPAAAGGSEGSSGREGPTTGGDAHGKDHAGRGSSGHHGEHCDDGSYDHHGDHHGGHHSHHDTIEWLRGAIPGEPDDDYPILSRVNSTSFRCADQKHPGFYADVEARCQIFHICQADGRQDSFLCPNGTIFSQRTLVCVWWNGFNCEDAPKLYHLNELLYKTTNGEESPQAAALPAATNALRPLNGMMTPLRPRGMRARGNDDALAALAPDDDGGDDSSPIDGLVRAMRGRDESMGTSGLAGGKDQASLRPDDEATIQRKSTKLDDEPQARLTRSRDNIPRRRRRASTRQAPPKLKSRRVSRNSRRRKLRHGIKPRRRA